MSSKSTEGINLNPFREHRPYSNDGPSWISFKRQESNPIDITNNWNWNKKQQNSKSNEGIHWSPLKDHRGFSNDTRNCWNSYKRQGSNDGSNWNPYKGMALKSNDANSWNAYKRP